MRLTRVHVSEPLAAGRRHTIEGDAANHITRVLRLEPGAPLTVFDGRGGEYSARIETLRKNAVIIEVQARSPSSRESSLSLTLAQGVSRGERMDWVVQKATELGVTAVVPVLTERTVVKLDARQSERKLAHWQGIAVAACEQSGRDKIPDIVAPLSLSDFLRAIDPQTTRLLLSPTGTQRVTDLKAPERKLVVLIGPEGGLAETEQRAAIGAGFLAVKMGPRILRTETAAVAALTLLQHQFGDL
ncbi:MAG TPA: 16S rRNA (uracil(1498)-N(3))-methyltransferase [Solirubrobacteraceae bacterium]|nr:16S rRNA (uracil(1498)-N(3))-methyltransferase [Solirubrobacteraceae bacterium]